MSTAISIKNITKYYKQFKALDDLSFEVKEGDFYGFLGPNGAGKTTTIKILTGLANCEQGKALVFGSDVISDYRVTRKLIGLVPQEFNFDPFLTAEQILEFEGGYFGLSRSEAKKRCSELLDQFELTDKRKGGYKKLSGGMKRRLLIARALMHKPKILILDEPTAGIDLELRYHLWEFLKNLNKEGTTIFLTTHYIEEAEQLCDTIGVIHQGRIVGEGPKEELVKKMSCETAEFVLKNPISEIPESLKDLDICLDETKTKLCFEESEGAVPKVLSAIGSLGTEVVKINVRKPKLEDAFLKLIGKK